ncbi:hypothetical protein HNY73_003065 [Argiope bruennichi]|uniref:Uncharacterized protein n=1 Tax=Argiope bruennichi TaxID=94029 RepID=A0A8T0FWV2_ARGBR|nr:hypothetical protein HNY73_003065 [Argiope bruennichi]
MFVPTEGIHICTRVAFPYSTSLWCQISASWLTPIDWRLDYILHIAFSNICRHVEDDIIKIKVFICIRDYFVFDKGQLIGALDQRNTAVRGMGSLRL